MTLLIDNYDSFAYNLYQYVGSLDPQVQVIRNDDLTVAEIEALHPTAVILSPGPGRPADAGVCEALILALAGKCKMLGVCLHLMKGTPYIYQGEELGMTNAGFTDLSDYRDLESINAYHELVEVQGVAPEQMMRYLGKVSRDNARTPMQWNTETNAGFTTGTPWIKVNDNYKTINAKSQVDDPDSIFNCYRKLVSFRKEYPVLVDGSFKLLLAEDENIFAYERKNADETLLVVCNFYGNTVKMPLAEETEDMELLISNYKETEDSSVLRPYEARMYYKK